MKCYSGEEQEQLTASALPRNSISNQLVQNGLKDLSGTSCCVLNSKGVGWIDDILRFIALYKNFFPMDLMVFSSAFSMSYLKLKTELWERYDHVLPCENQSANDSIWLE